MPDAAMSGNGGEKRAADWLCKRCKDHNGAAFKNFAFRTHCRECKVHKGSCCGGVAKDSKAAPTSSLAERQVALGKKADKQAQQAQLLLKKENEKLKQQLDKARSSAHEKEKDVGKADDKSELQELERCKALYAKLPGEELKVKELDVKIQALKGARAASIPAGEQLRRAEQTLAKKRKKKLALEEDVAELQQLFISKKEELEATVVEETEALAEVEKIKCSITVAAPRCTKHWADVADGCSEWVKVMPTELLQQQGLDSDSLATFDALCRKLAACSEAAKVSRAEKEEALKQQDAAAATSPTVNVAASGEPDVVMGRVVGDTPGGGIASGEPAAKIARTDNTVDIDDLCNSSNPDEAAAGRRCKELLAARGEKRASRE